MTVTGETSLGDRMKAYERVNRTVLARNTATVIRVDGRGFSKYLEHADKPFDVAVGQAMDAVAMALCQEAAGAVFAYAQSDEASVLLTDYQDVHAEPWFGGVVQKIASVSASVATVAFAGEYAVRGKLGQFDARVFTLPNAVEAANYFLGRQQDAYRNAISRAAQANFPHQDLQGLNGDQLQEKLYQEKGINFRKDYPDQFRRGGIVTRVPRTSVNVDVIARGLLTVTATRNPWEPQAAPDFRAEPGSFLARIIPPLPAFTQAGA